MIFETSRLYFRELAETDDAAMFELDSDPEVHQYLGQHPITSMEEARKNIKMIRQQYLDLGIGRYAIIEKDSHDFVGWGAFKFITEPINGHQFYHDLGYRLIKRYWGMGYATESSRGAVDYAFNRLKLPAIYAIADAGNLQSQKVLEKCGLVRNGMFEYEGLPHYWFEMKNPNI
jgi:ribosomal-protein-alanine N-acetyltransferase